MELVAGHDVVMTSGATIHTRDGMLVNAKKREMVPAVDEKDKVDWANLRPAKDIGEGWFEKGIETKGGGASARCRSWSRRAKVANHMWLLFRRRLDSASCQFTSSPSLDLGVRRTGA
jgi:hypothetical protein